MIRNFIIEFKISKSFIKIVASIPFAFYYHNNPQLVFPMDHLVILDHIIMMALLQYGDLLIDLSLVNGGLEDLHRDLLAVQQGLVHDPVGALPDQLHELHLRHNTI